MNVESCPEGEEVGFVNHTAPNAEDAVERRGEQDGTRANRILSARRAHPNGRKTHSAGSSVGRQERERMRRECEAWDRKRRALGRLDDGFRTLERRTRLLPCVSTNLSTL